MCSGNQSASFHQTSSENFSVSWPPGSQIYFSIATRKNKEKAPNFQVQLDRYKLPETFETENISIQFHGKSLIPILVASYRSESLSVMLTSRSLQAFFTTWNHSWSSKYMTEVPCKAIDQTKPLWVQAKIRWKSYIADSGFWMVS